MLRKVIKGQINRDGIELSFEAFSGALGSRYVRLMDTDGEQVGDFSCSAKKITTGVKFYIDGSCYEITETSPSL